MAIPVQVAGELVIRVDDLPVPIFEQIKAALTFANEEKAKKLAIKQFGAWDLPDTVSLWRIEERRGGERVLCLPRGFAAQLSRGLAAEGLALQWVDERVHVSAAEGYWRPLHLRGYQFEAEVALLTAEQGIYMCPAGGGKTIVLLGTAALANQRTLMITDKAYLANQWRARAAAPWLDRAQTVRGLDLSLDFADDRSSGLIGQDIWEERDFTVALRQTLWSRKWELDPTGWWATWGMVIIDEVHHAAADTLAELVRSIQAAILLGGSATPAKSEMRGQIVYATVGPIVHETSRERLYQEGVLVKSNVVRVATDFEADFWPTHDASLDDDGQLTCLVPRCPKTKKGVKHGHRDNYSSVLKKLVESKDRNAQIAQKICEHRGHVHLVFTRQLKHIDLLAKALKEAGWDGPVYKIRGEENASGEAQKIAEELETVDEAVIFSTVAEEGMDIPPIDRTWSVFPMKQEAALIQLIGRGERALDGKDAPIFFDVFDSGCSVFQGHAGERYGVYYKQGYEVREEVAAT